MAFSFDMDIYSWLLEEVLKVSPSGDPVNDAVYLILLPMVVLYMYSDFVISKSRFMGSHGKFKYIMMFIVGFVIVREGYYAFFASMSLPLLGLIMIWHAFSFVMGWGQKKEADREKIETVGFQPGSRGGSWSPFQRLIHPITSSLDKAMKGASFATWDRQQFREEAGRLRNEWNRQEQLVQGSTSVFGNVNSRANEALEKQEMIEEELRALVLGAMQKGLNVDELIPEERLRKSIKFRLGTTTG